MAKTVRITDAFDARLDAYFRLTDGQMRKKTEPEKGIFIAEAQTVIEVALCSGCFPVSGLCDEAMLNRRALDVIGRCRAVNPEFELYISDRAVLREMTGFELTRGMLCAMRRPKLPDAHSLLAGATRVAVLEGIADAANVGAIMRAAAGLDIDAVLLTPSCCDPLLRRSIRVSMGNVFKVPWTYIGAFPEGLDFLKGEGFRTAALALTKDALPLDDDRLKKEEKLAMLFGTEGDGLKKETIAGADYTVIIPMANGVDSLNVAAASAVAFWELRKRR